MRRLPVYLLLDTSGSMRGEPIEAVNTGLRVMLSSLRQDPHALETVHICIITFDAEAKMVVPLTALDELQVPEITTPESGPTHLGLALEMLDRQLKRDLIRSTPERKGDWAPFLFVMTDGKPSDTMLFEDMCAVIRAGGFANIVGCLAGPKARRADLERLCQHVVALDTMDSAAFNGFFKWVTSTIASGSRSMGVAGEVPLPPPPAEIQLVL